MTLWVWVLAGVAASYVLVVWLLVRAGALEDQARAKALRQMAEARARARRELLDAGGLDALARIGDTDE